MRWAVLAAVSAALIAAGAASPAGGFETFRTPSGNIACGYLAGFGTSLRCDIRSGLKPRPARPASCDLDYGGSVGLRPTGRASVLCVGDTVADPKAKVLRYGTTWRRGPFTCTSRTAGLRCSNRAGHGFFLSRERWYRF